MADRPAPTPPHQNRRERTMKYTVIMYGTTGEYRQQYKSKVKAERAAANIRGLGYEAKVIKNEKAA